MARVTPADVRAVIETDLADTEIQPYIDDAALEIDERVSVDAVDYSDARLKKLEKYLSAHLVRFLRERQEGKQTVSQGSAQLTTDYTGAFGEGLLATSAGQVVLDTDIEDVFATPGTDDEAGRFVSQSRYVRTISGSDPSGVESAEQPR